MDMCLNEKIDRATYELKFEELETSLTESLEQKEPLEQSAQEEIDMGKRLKRFRKVFKRMKFYSHLTVTYLKAFSIK